MLVLLLADLVAFDVEAAIEAPNGSPNRTPLLQLKGWQAEVEQVIVAHCIVKVSADMRKHSVVTKTWLGQNLAPTYEINADVFTGVNRPATICASPCASDFGGGWRDSGRSHSRNTATISHPARGQRGGLRRRDTERWIDLVTTRALSSICPGIDT